MKRFSLFLSLGLLFTSFHAVQAGIIYSQTQPEEPSGAFSSEDKDEGQIIANRFFLNSDASVTIRSMRFLGGYGITAPPPYKPSLDNLPLDTFHITFLEDVAGNPGAPIMNGNF